MQAEMRKETPGSKGIEEGGIGKVIGVGLVRNLRLEGWIGTRC